MERAQAKILYRRLFLLTVSIAGLYFLYKVRTIMIPFIFAFFIAYILNPMVQYVETKKVPRGLAILTVYLIVFSFFTGIVVFGVPLLIQELNKLGHAIPVLAEEINNIMTRIEKRYSSFLMPEVIKTIISERIRNVESGLVEVVRAGTTTVVQMFSYLICLIVAPVFAFYILKDFGRIRDSFELTIPRSYRSDVMAIVRDLDEIISGFIRGHLVISAIIGTLTGLGMYLIGADFYLIIGITAAIAELIPYIGPFITAVPAVALSLLVSKQTAVYAVIVILIVQQLENSVISPKILGHNLGLHPLVIIFALLAGGELMGFIGLLIGVPLAASIKVALRYIYLKLVDEK